MAATMGFKWGLGARMNEENDFISEESKNYANLALNMNQHYFFEKNGSV